MGELDRPGVIYRISYAYLLDRYADQISVVGWQPLPRPEEQRAVGIRMQSHEDFSRLPSTQMIHFRHSAQVSHRIWLMFDKGEALFPQDVVEEMAAEAKSVSTFTSTQLHRAWKSMEAFSLFCPNDPKVRRAIEMDAGVTISNKNALSWDSCVLERCEETWRDRVAKMNSNLSWRRGLYI